MSGARNSKGEMLYADWAWDRGIGGKTGEAYNQGWRSWKIGAYDGAANSAIIAGLGSGAVSAVFTTPPTVVPAAGAGPVSYLLGVDLDKDAGKIYSESGVFTKSAWDFMMASSTDLSGYKKRNGKLMIVHGVSDPVFSINDTISWWNDLNKANNGAAADFVRLFAVPGMNHCGGGPATDQFDAFSALVNWVEKSQPPGDSQNPITAWNGPNDTGAYSRPICKYPDTLTYVSGPITSASSFTCTPQTTDPLMNAEDALPDRGPSESTKPGQ